MRSTLGTATVVVALAAGAGGCITMNPSVVDPDAWLRGAAAPAELYANGAAIASRPAPALLPVLDVRIDPMDRLFLVNIADDPVYEGVELQTFPRPGSEPEVRVLLWQRDTVDVYDRPGREFDEAADRRGLEALLSPRVVTQQRADFEYRFLTTQHGLDAALRITDRQGREVVVEVIETRGAPVRGGLIAPVGATSAAPDYLPVFFLDEFALVKRAGTRVHITIDGERRAPQKLPRIMRGPASYFSRYSDRVVIAHWNERREGELGPVPVAPGTRLVEAGGLAWHLTWTGGRAEVDAAVARQGDDAVTLRFAPPLPELPALVDGARLEGRFVINVNDVPGVVAGEYAVARSGDQAELVFRPQLAWQPPIVRGPSWVSTYRYEARVDLAPDVPVLRSGWTRASAATGAGAGDGAGVADAPPAKRHALVPLPVVFYTPETRWAGGVAAIHTFRPAPGVRPTITAFSGLYTQNAQVSVELQTNGYLRGDAYSVSGGLGHTRFPEKFYGIGNATTAEDGELFTARGTRGDLTVRRRIAPGVYAGGRYEQRRSEILEREADGLLAGGTITGAEGGFVAGAGVSLPRDTRDDVLFPTAGSLHTAAVLRTGGPLGGDHRFTRYTLDLRRYFPVGGQVLGVQAYARTMTGDVPFDMLPRLGGQNLMRGTLGTRYRDRTMVAAQAEYRMHLWRRLGGVVFAGAGQVAERPGDVAFADLHPSVGYGLRFRLNPRDRLNLRLDFGYGRGGAGGMYITASEAF
jgi:hypothetical protein